MKTTLLFPPQWTAAQPYFGLSLLNGQLRAHGHDVVIRDLNLEYMEWALSPQAAALALRRLESDRVFVAAEHAAAREREPGSPRALMLEARLLETEGFLRHHGDDVHRLATRVDAARTALREPAVFFQPPRLLEAMVATDTALQLLSLPHYPAAVKWNDFLVPMVPFNLEPMLEFCQDPLRNPFFRFLERWLPTLRDDRSDVLALSIASFSQVLPGLTLAVLLREHASAWATGTPGRRPVVVLGGNFFTRLRQQLLALPAFFRNFADCVVTGEGERSLVQLAAAVERPGDPATHWMDVGNMLYLENDRVVATAEQPGYSLGEMALQDFTGFQLDRYLAPERVVCLRASKGCYYGQCAFCDCDFGLTRDKVAADRVVEEMAQLKQRFGITHFEFVDQCLAPEMLHALSDALVRADLGVHWFCNARTDGGFTTQLFEKMRLAGNTMVMWGVESGSARLLKLMKKGVSPAGRLDILRRASAAGVWNFAYIFFGFPTETENEAMETIDLVRDNTDIIHAYGRSVFTLGRHARMMTDLERFGVTEWSETHEDLSTNLSFRPSSGLAGGDVDRIARDCNTLCREAYGDPLWMALRSRENLHLYLAHHGRDFVERCDLSSALRGTPDVSFVF